MSGGKRKPPETPAALSTASIGFQFVRNSAFSSRLIEWFGAGYYSHVDCVLDNGALLGARDDVVSGKPPGVQIRKKDYETWERRTLVRLEVTQRKHDDWVRFLTNQLDKPYDQVSIFGFMTGRDWREDDSWFCSELATRSLEIAKVVPDPLALACNKVTPGTLACIVSAIGGVIVEDVHAG